MAVKPYQIEALLAEMAPEFGPDTVVISVAAGISIARLQAAVGGRCPVVRCMPNTPALVGKGVFALCFDDKVPAESKEDILRFFSQLGVCLELPESRFTAFSALIGAGPAYVFGMMQGLVQAGVTLGLGRKECRDMVAAPVRRLGRHGGPQRHAAHGTARPGMLARRPDHRRGQCPRQGGTFRPAGGRGAGR